MAAAAPAAPTTAASPKAKGKMPPPAPEDDEARAFREAVLAQAAHLGMDPEADAEFLW